MEELINGKGSKTLYNGTRETGLFKDGYLIEGTATYLEDTFFPTGTVKKGKFNYDGHDGLVEGTITYPDGKVEYVGINEK